MATASPAGRRPVVFTNRAGRRLFGILHTPAAASDLGVIFLSPGVKMRVGPQRLYNRLTDELVSMGLPVLRFDFYGLGDSEGTLAEELLKDVYNHIEVGRFVDDTVDAMDWMQRECGTARFILSGLCGGAITGLLAGARDERVAGLLGLGITPVLASQAADPSLYMTAGQLNEIGATYLSKVADPRAWLRLLTFRSDYRLLWRAIGQRVRRRKGAQTPEAAAPAAPAPGEPDNASPLFPPAYFTMLERRRPMLLVFGGADRLHFEYEEKFVARHRARLASAPPLCQVHVVPQANHVLSLAAWQHDMIDVSRRWLTTHFADTITPHAVAAVRS